MWENNLTEQLCAQVAEERKQTVHKARPMPKFSRLEVNCIYSISQSADILFTAGGGKPEEGDNCHLAIFAHQEECQQGVKMIRAFFKLLEISA